MAISFCSYVALFMVPRSKSFGSLSFLNTATSQQSHPGSPVCLLNLSASPAGMFTSYGTDSSPFPKDIPTSP